MSNASTDGSPSLLTLAGLVSDQVQVRDVPDAAWPELISLAVRHDLGPMLHYVVARAGLRVPGDPVWTSLVQTARDAIVHTIVLEDAQSRLQTALATAGVPALWLKGIALAQTAYPLPTLRPMVDLDVLVPYADRERARTAAAIAGFRSADAYSFEAAPDLTHYFSYAYTLRGGAHDAVIVELHFHLLDRPRSRSPLHQTGIDWFWEHSVTWTRDGVTFRCPRPEAHLLYLAAHAILQHGEHDFRPLRFFDVHRIVCAASVDWQLLVDRAVDLRWTYAVERCLAIAARLFATSVPEWVCPTLRGRRPADEDVFCVVDRNMGTNRWTDLLAQLGTMPLSDRARVVRLLVLPPRAHVRHRYAVPDSAPAWPHYPRLWRDQAREVVRWIWRRRVATTHDR